MLRDLLVHRARASSDRVAERRRRGRGVWWQGLGSSAGSSGSTLVVVVYGHYFLQVHSTGVGFGFSLWSGLSSAASCRRRKEVGEDEVESMVVLTK